MSGMTKQLEEKIRTNGTIMDLVGCFLMEPARSYDIEQYKNPDMETVSLNRHRFMVGNAHMIAYAVVINGGTFEDIQKAVEYLAVCIDANKYQLDTKKAFDDLKIQELIDKYKGTKYSYPKQKEMTKEELAEAPAKRQRMVQMLDAKRKIFKGNVQKLHEEGFSNEEIAGILRIPESTVRLYMAEN